MKSILNEYVVYHIITSRKLDDTIDACFNVFQLHHDATYVTVKSLHLTFLKGSIQIRIVLLVTQK